MTYSANGSSDRVFGLDLLRAVAVLMVLVAHGRYMLLPLLPWTSRLSIFGFLGVELFFVLSGFLIGGIILRTFTDAPTREVLVHFWIRRWFRTLPNYYLFLSVNIVIWTAVGHSVADVTPYAVFAQNFASASGRFFNESWSLAVEEWFYLLFPLLLWAGIRIGLDLRAACAAAMVVLLAASSGARLAAVTFGDPTWDAAVRKVVIFRFDALMFGVLGAWTHAYFPAAWERLRRPGMAAGTVLAAVVVFAYYGTNRDDSVFARTWMFTATSSAVLAFLPAFDRWRSARGILATWTRRISLWSYSLYLCQLPVAKLLKVAFGDPLVLGIEMGSVRILALTAAYGVISIGLAALTHHWFEKPAMNLRERLSHGSAAAVRSARAIQSS